MGIQMGVVVVEEEDFKNRENCQKGPSLMAIF